MEQVRYAARLDTGEGFIAFAGGYLVTPEPHLEVGEIELPEGLTFGDGQAVWPFPKVRRVLPDGYAVWPFPKVRRMVPTDGEFVYLVGRSPRPQAVDKKMVTDLGDDTFLVVTDEPVIGALWGGQVLEFVFDRAAYIEVAMA